MYESEKLIDIFTDKEEDTNTYIKSTKKCIQIQRVKARAIAGETDRQKTELHTER